MIQKVTIGTQDFLKIGVLWHNSNHVTCSIVPLAFLYFNFSCIQIYIFVTFVVVSYSFQIFFLVLPLLQINSLNLHIAIDDLNGKNTLF